VEEEIRISQRELKVNVNVSGYCPVVVNLTKRIERKSSLS